MRDGVVESYGVGENPSGGEVDDPRVGGNPIGREACA